VAVIQCHPKEFAMPAKPKKQPFPKVPLEFGQFIGGLLKVDPKKLPSAKKKAAKKSAGKKKG
jgi:hypothetical protein